MFAVMRAYPWTALETDYTVKIEVARGPGLPTKWIPVFDTLEDAEKWSGNGEDIFRIVAKVVTDEGGK